MIKRTIPLLFTVVLPLFPAPNPTQATADVRAAYTKFEYRIPMRDGVRHYGGPDGSRIQFHAEE